MERLVDIVALVFNTNERGEPIDGTSLDWRHGLIQPQTYMDIIHCPPGMMLEDMVMQLNGLPEGARFGVIDILEDLTPAHWNQWRSLS